jgi:WD40 repeat protein
MEQSSDSIQPTLAQIAAALRQWQQQQQQDAFLMDGELLQTLQSNWTTLASHLSPLAREFSQRSLDRDLERLAAMQSLATVALQEPLQRVRGLLKERPVDAAIWAIHLVGTSLDCLDRATLPNALVAVLHEVAEVARERMVVSLGSGAIASVAISPDGRYIASGHDDGCLCLWNSEGERIGEPLRGHNGAVMAVAFRPDASQILSGGSDGTLLRWDLGGQSVGEPFYGHEDAVWSVAYSPDGQTIASTGGDGVVQLWTEAGQPLGSPLQGSQRLIRSLTFAGNGHWLIGGGGDGRLHIWSCWNDAPLRIVRGHDDAILALALSPNERWLATGSWDGTIRIWTLQGEPVTPEFDRAPTSDRTQAAVTAIAFLSSGDRIVSGSRNGTLQVWDLAGNPIGPPLRGHTATVSAIAASPDEQWVISSSREGTLRMWDLEATSPLCSGVNSQMASISDLAVLCKRLQFHAALRQPLTAEARSACAICERYVWSQSQS